LTDVAREVSFCGQPPLTDGFNLIIAEGAHGIIKPPGGNNTEVARRRGDILVGSGPRDNFVFETLKASKRPRPAIRTRSSVSSTSCTT
jgi:hypothetical protein